MTFRWPGDQLGAVLLIDKPSGPTSFDMIRKARKSVGIKKVGHTGTLDPLASGLLVVCLGEGTKLVPYLMSTEKRYLAEITLGTATNTDDSQGEIITSVDASHVNEAQVADALAGFVGEIEQIPPQFAAIKQGGEPVYVKARRGERVELQARRVTINKIDLVDFDAKRMVLRLRVDCGKGTYIRSLARDLGIALGTVAHLSALRRELNAGFEVDDPRVLRGDAPWELGDLSTKAISIAAAADRLAGVVVDEQQQADLLCGRQIAAADLRVGSGANDSVVRLENAAGQLVAIAREESGAYQPVRVFAV